MVLVLRFMLTIGVDLRFHQAGDEFMGWFQLCLKPKKLIKLKEMKTQIFVAYIPATLGEGTDLANDLANDANILHGGCEKDSEVENEADEFV